MNIKSKKLTLKIANNENYIKK